MEQGPQLGHMLDQIRNWWIDHDCNAGYDDCMETLKRIMQASP
jgi:hypothetical protein